MGLQLQPACYLTMLFDPLRKREVADTPEERVRQWFIGVLKDPMGVPEHFMMSEVSLKLGSKPFRADIVVWSKQAEPLMIVECKRPDVKLTEAVTRQALVYNNILNVKYIAVTNGNSTRIFSRSGEEFLPLPAAPSWEEMICPL